MQDLYRGFKKTSEDDSSATLEHDSGHSLTIAKSGLSKKQKHALSKLPLHQAKPKQVIQQPETVTTSEDQAKSVGANIADAVANKILEGATEAATPAQQPELTPQQIEQMPEPNALDVSTGQPVYKRAPEFAEGEGLTPEERLEIRKSGAEIRDPYRVASEVALKQDPLAYASDLEELPEEKSLETERALAQEPVAVPKPTLAPAVAPTVAPQPQLVPEEAPALTDDERFSRTLLDPKIPPSQKHQVYLERVLKKQLAQDEYNRKFYEEMKNEQVSPTNLLHDRSTLGKIGTVIAMAFSGIGAGVTGKENMVMQVLNDQINREIEAQKRSQERKFNLHKFHNEQFQNSLAADAQVAADILNMTKLQTEEMLYGFGNNPMVKKRAMALNAELDAKIAESNAKIAELRTGDDLKSLLAAQVGTAGVPSKLKPAQVLQLKKGDASVKTEATKEIEKREQLVANAPKAVAALDRALEELGSKKGFIKGLGSLAYAQVDEPQALKDFRSAIKAMVPDIAGTNKDAMVRSILEDLEPKPFEVYKGEADKIRARVLNWLQQQASTPNLDRLGIDPQAFESTSVRPETWGAKEDIKKPSEGKIIQFKGTNQKYIAKDGVWVPYGK